VSDPSLRGTGSKPGGYGPVSGACHVPFEMRGARPVAASRGSGQLTSNSVIVGVGTAGVQLDASLVDREQVNTGTVL
jgi:hypothetical protein